MSVLRFHRRDRRQRDPFAAPAATAPPVPCGRNATGWPLVRDAIGVRPATGGEMVAPAYDSRIDVGRALADLAAQAEAESRVRTEKFVSSGSGGRHAHPPWTTAPQPAAPDLDAEAGDWYGWDTTVLDNPPAHDGRPYIPGDLGRPGRLSPAAATVREDLGGCLIFRDAVHAEFVRRDRVHGIRHDGGWLDSWTTAAERRLAAGYPQLPDFRISEMMHARFAGMLAMHVTERAA